MLKTAISLPENRLEAANANKYYVIVLKDNKYYVIVLKDNKFVRAYIANRETVTFSGDDFVRTNNLDGSISKVFSSMISGRNFAVGLVFDLKVSPIGTATVIYNGSIIEVVANKCYLPGSGAYLEIMDYSIDYVSININRITEKNATILDEMVLSRNVVTDGGNQYTKYFVYSFENNYDIIVNTEYSYNSNGVNL